MAWGVISQLELLLPVSLPHQLFSRNTLFRLQNTIFLGFLYLITFLLRRA